MTSIENQDHTLLLFDGVCNLCNGTVNWIIHHDPKGLIHFASLQSNYAQEKLKIGGYESKPLSSVVLIKEGQYFTQSEAILQVLKEIKPGGILSILLSWVPKPVRDWGYTLIAQNRYRIFGKKDTCMIPKSEWTIRFPEMSGISL